MFYSELRTIGVFMSEAGAYFQNELCRAISAQAKQLGINIAFFTNFNDYGNNTEYIIGERSISELPPYESLDGIIIVPDSYADHLLLGRIKEQIRKRSNCPVISIRSKMSGAHSVIVNDNQSMERMVQHFIKKHGYTKIAFLSGPKDHPDAIMRLDAYRKVLEQEGIMYNPNYVFYGDFWRNRGKEAADFFFNDSKEKPEAIICANDYMALSLYRALVDKDIMVPEDVAISGFDDVREAADNLPPLTTVAVPIDKMAKTALSLILDKLAGNEIPEISYIDTELKLRNSCGCETTDFKSIIKARMKLSDDYDRAFQANIDHTFLSISLENASSCEEIADALHLEALPQSTIKSIFICLCEGKSKYFPKVRKDSCDFAKRMHTLAGFANNKVQKPVTIATKELLPRGAASSEPIIYYFLPLHYLKSIFGYVAIEYKDNICYERTFQNWMTIMSNAFETVRMNSETNRLIEQLNELYIHDSLTGLYNRRGFERLSAKLFNESIDLNENIMIIALDMDDLKVINDKHGHLQGDLALKSIATALTYASTKDEICARVGGDEFNVIAKNYTSKDLDRFVRRFYEYLDHVNEENSRYVVTASYGSYLTNAGEDRGLEEYINLSDARLYEHKRKRKSVVRDTPRHA